MPHSIAAEKAEERRQRSGGRAAVAPSHQSLIDELEAAISRKNIASRAEILRRITDLFAAGSANFGSEQTSLFDDVMGRLVNEIDHSARAAFGERIADLRNTPPGITRELALDDSIDVAGAVLRRSESVDEDTLITGARTKGQDHLLAISQRSQLSENITDVLVERGDQKVVISTAANAGARFSDFGYTKLVSRSKHDNELALLVWSRPEIPRDYLLRLFESASDAVQKKFEAADRGKADLVHEMIKQAADQLQTSLRDHSSDFAAARAHIEDLHKNGQLTEARLCRFAELGKFDETVLALSLLAELPVGAIERALVHDTGDQVLVLAKSIDLSWRTARAVLGVRSGASGEFPEYHERFNRLRPETARAAIQFYRLRERAAKTRK
jgi:uncharacterized protein (DUF2336 family)